MSAPAKASCSKRLLIELNVKTFEATFYNGKKLSIEYLFHSEVMGEECLQVGLNSLKPLFGGITPPGIPQFTCISKLSNFLRLINMDDCSHGDYASCACRHKIEPGQEHSDYRCRDNHWHHYCTGHVHQWLQFYLERAILLKESRKHYEYRVSTGAIARASHRLLLFMRRDGNCRILAKVGLDEYFVAACMIKPDELA